MGKVVSAKPIHKSRGSSGALREVYAELCYYYPQYTLKEAQELPARDVKLLLRVAQKQEAQRMFNLVQIVASPHTKGGKGVKKLSDFYKKEFSR